jgi:hypothetical protein
MGNLLYIIVVVLIISWAISCTGYGTKELVYVLLILAGVVVLLRAMQGSRV